MFLTLTEFHSIASLHALMAAFVELLPWQDADPCSTWQTRSMPLPIRVDMWIGLVRCGTNRPKSIGSTSTLTVIPIVHEPVGKYDVGKNRQYSTHMKAQFLYVVLCYCIVLCEVVRYGS